MLADSTRWSPPEWVASTYARSSFPYRIANGHGSKKKRYTLHSDTPTSFSTAYSIIPDLLPKLDNPQLTTCDLLGQRGAAWTANSVCTRAVALMETLRICLMRISSIFLFTVFRFRTMASVAISFTSALVDSHTRSLFGGGCIGSDYEEQKTDASSTQTWEAQERHGGVC